MVMVKGWIARKWLVVLGGGAAAELEWNWWADLVGGCNRGVGD